MATPVVDVALEPKKESEPKRRSFLSNVKALETRLVLRRSDLENAQRDVYSANAAYAALEAEVSALAAAYDLVKPQPRTRKGKA